MRRFAHFVLKFLIQTFFKKFGGGVRGRAPADTAFSFWSFFFCAFLVQKKKRLNAMGAFGRTDCFSAGDLLIHHCVVPLPRWGRLHEQIRTLCFKVFAPLFSKSGQGLGQRPKCRPFFFWSFFSRLRSKLPWPYCLKEKKAAKWNGLFGVTGGTSGAPYLT